jgi:hypothetical protein
VTAPAARVVLDNEAVQALSDVAHSKHRRVLAFFEVVNQRSGRRRQPMTILVPVAVRIEARWDRRAPSAASLNRISRARDVALDGSRADRSAELRAATGVSVVDATVAQAAEASTGPAAILTSDTADLRRLATLLDGDVRVVRL